MLLVEKHCHIQARGFLRHYHYRSDPKLGPGIFSLRRIPCICYACTAILYLSWYPKIREALNEPRYGRVYNRKYSQIIGCHNNCILINFLYDGTDEEYYENINRTILDGIVMNMYLINIEVKYGAIDTDDSLCNAYYIIKFSS